MCSNNSNAFTEQQVTDQLPQASRVTREMMRSEIASDTTFTEASPPLSNLVTAQAPHRSSVPTAPDNDSGSNKKVARLQQPQCVVETDDTFLQLWPQRFDFLYAVHPDPGAAPNWRTESRYPLADRLIQQGAHLYGVRFAPETRYAMLDIDAGSPYHPQKDIFAIQRMIDALEPIGLVRHLTVRSSDSGGLHLYLPFTDALPSWQIGLVISTLLENTGFKVMPGWLEVFPNKRYASPDGQLSLFNGHRLPLQQGSYLLNADFDPIASAQSGFVQRWKLATAQNLIDKKSLEQILRTALRRNYRVSTKAAKFLNDLNCEIELGWSGRGMTNRLLGRIALRSFVFGHVLYAASPLMGEALVKDIIRTAKQLPGFDEWCQHKDDLKTRAKEWAQSVEKNPRYYPYSHDTAPNTQKQTEPGWHERQKQAARERIQRGVQILIERELWPETITARYDSLISFGISGSTLYKYRDLWHPKYIEQASRSETEPKGRKDVCLKGNVRHSQAYCSNVDDPYFTSGSAELEAPTTQQLCNLSAPSAYAPPPQLKLDVLEAIATAKTTQDARRKRALHQQSPQSSQQLTAHLAKLRALAASTDPILAAEGKARLQELGF